MVSNRPKLVPITKEKNRSSHYEWSRNALGSKLSAVIPTGKSHERSRFLCATHHRPDPRPHIHLCFYSLPSSRACSFHPIFLLVSVHPTTATLVRYYQYSSVENIVNLRWKEFCSKERDAQIVKCQS